MPIGAGCMLAAGLRRGRSDRDGCGGNQEARTDMANRHWTLDDLPWDQFDASKVDPEVLKIVKAAAMVEYNGRDYATYLCNVFHDDPEFQ